MMNDNNMAGLRHLNLDDRQAAERKLSRLFGSFGIDAMAARERLIDPFISRAAQFWRGHHGGDFASLVMDEAEIELQAWFTRILGAEDENGRMSLMTGRAAFLMCGGARRFSDLFLLPIEDLPGDFVQAMRDHAPQAVPPNDDGEMHHQPYEAWSIRQVVAKAMPIDRSVMPAFADFIRRDGRGFGFIWRNTGPTS